MKRSPLNAYSTFHGYFTGSQAFVQPTAQNTILKYMV